MANRPTVRQLEVINLIADGKSNKEIAAVLGISKSTVDNIISAALRRMGKCNRVQLATWLLRLPQSRKGP